MRFSSSGLYGVFGVACLLNGHASAAVNLLTNGDFSSGNSGFTSGYDFVGTGQSTTPGTYGVRSLSTDFNSAYNAFGDHTSGTGNMMLVDGVSGTAVWTETVAVARNGIGNFSGWATTSDGANLPILEFSIDGSVIGTDLPLTAATTGANWTPFTATWNAGSNTSATITITDVNPSALSTGNDFAIDDLSFSVTVPEPVALLPLSAGALAMFARRRRPE